jgi:acetyl esterase/lipase
MQAFQRLITLILCFMALYTHAQRPTTLPLWPDGIPNQIPTDAAAAAVEYYTEDSVFIVRDVVIPTLTVFEAPADKRTGRSILILPGGGYWVVAERHEGEELAKYFNAQGITAFVLRYRLPDPILSTKPRETPLDDARQAMRYIRQNSAKWGISTQQVGIMGFSAGGHLASTLCTHDEVAGTPTRPDWAVLVYPVISFGPKGHSGSRERLLGPDANDTTMVARYSNELRVTKQTPPTILFHSLDDEAVPYENSLLYAEALKRAGVATELHLFDRGGHGYGMGRKLGGAVATWPEICMAWVKSL